MKCFFFFFLFVCLMMTGRDWGPDTSAKIIVGIFSALLTRLLCFRGIVELKIYQYSWKLY